MLKGVCTMKRILALGLCLALLCPAARAAGHSRARQRPSASIRFMVHTPFNIRFLFVL